MRIVQDNCQLGVWVACVDCAFSGDIIDVYANHHKVSEAVAISVLEESGVLGGKFNREHLLQVRARHVREPAETGNVLWEESSRGGRAIVEAESQSLMHRMHLRVPTQVSWAASTAGRVVGFAKARRIEKLMRDNSRNTQARVRDRRFTLPNDADGTLVMPFYDVPGRICSFTFLHAAHRSMKWSINDHYLSYGTASQPYQEGGLAMPPEIMRHSGDGTLLLTADPATYLKMHLKHTMHSQRPLQLACYRNRDVVTSSWQFVANRDLILWCQKVRPQDFWLAITLNAKITTYGPKREPLNTVVRRREPIDAYNAAVRNAEFWPDRLAKLISKLETEDLTDWLIRMSLNTQQQQMVLDACPSKYRSKLDQALNNTVVTKMLQHGDGTVEQRTDGWFYVRSNQSSELITDAPFWIDQAISQTTATGAEQLYVVRTRHKGQEVSFEAPVRKFEKDPYSWVQQALIANAIGAPSQAPSWKSKAHYISLQFQSPTVMRRSSVMGYSKKDNCFYLPRYTIDANTGAHTVSSSGVADGLPGRSISISRVYDAQLGELMSQESTNVYWAIFTSFMTQMLAPAADVQVPQFLFRSKSLYKPVAQMANLLGIPVEVETKAKKLREQIDKHKWPVVAGVPSMLPSSSRKSLLQSTGTPICMPVSLTEQIFAELSGTAVTVDSPGTVKLIDVETLRTFQPIAGQLLQYFFQHRMVEELHHRNNPAYGVLLIIERWLKGRKVKLQTNAVRELIHGDHLIANALPRATAMLVATGSIDYCQVDSTSRLEKEVQGRKNAAVYRLKEGNRDEVFIPRMSVQKALDVAGAPKLDHGEMAARLAEEGYKVRIEMLSSQIGFMISGQSFDWQLKKRRAAARKLRVVSAS